MNVIVGIELAHNVIAKTDSSWRIMRRAPSSTLGAGEGENDQGTEHPEGLPNPPIFALGLIPQ
jgi:hypothetical protein